MRRPALAFSLLLLLATSLVAGPAAAATFGFDDVTALARQAAALPYSAPRAAVPAELAALDYDGRRDIRYRPERSLWRAEGLPFEVQFFHLSGANDLAVQVHEVHDGQAHLLGYDPAAWDFGRHRFDRSGWRELGHAGFRVHAALNSTSYKDELIVFLGASYFRALGRGQQYGLSARGLAIDTVGGRSGEEFPRFTAFWLRRPKAGDTALTIDALLDSPRVTGAYRFVVKPGDNTTVDVQARVFPRAGAAPVAMLGIAPLTSMYLHGENQPRATDFRPEVHDSDGLLVAGGPAGGTIEWLWRPLAHPARALASSFQVERLHGFGLMQRDRRFASYEDTEAHYERRPSAWVEPLGVWGPGRVQLLLLPTPDETHDNVVATWVPATLPAPGQSLDLAWRLHWQGDTMQQPPNGWTVQSRLGRGWLPPDPSTVPANEVQFTVDFDGPALRALPAGASVDAVASTSTPGARITEARAYPHPQGGWRMLLRALRPATSQPLELRAFLRSDGHALTETWTALVPQETR